MHPLANVWTPLRRLRCLFPSSWPWPWLQLSFGPALGFYLAVNANPPNTSPWVVVPMIFFGAVAVYSGIGILVNKYSAPAPITAVTSATDHGHVEHESVEPEMPPRSASLERPFVPPYWSGESSQERDYRHVQDIKAHLFDYAAEATALSVNVTIHMDKYERWHADVRKYVDRWLREEKLNEWDFILRSQRARNEPDGRRVFVKSRFEECAATLYGWASPDHGITRFDVRY